MPNISDLQLAAFSKIYGSGLSINDMWIKFLSTAATDPSPYTWRHKGTHAFMRDMNAAARPQTIAVMGDSTGAGTDKWVYKLMQKLAARFPEYTVRYWEWNDTMQGWTPPLFLTATYQTGTAGEAYHLTNGTTLSLVCAPVAASTGYNIVGDQSHRAKFEPDGAWASITLGGQAAGGSQNGKKLEIDAAGKVVWSHSGSGADWYIATSTVAVPHGFGDKGWVRADLDVDNGSSGWTVTFYTSTDEKTWTALGSPVTTGTVAAVYGASTAGFGIANINGASNAPAGKIYEYKIFNGIGSTTQTLVLAWCAGDTWASGVTAGYLSGCTDICGNVFSSNAASITLGFVGAPTLNVRNASVSGKALTYFDDTSVAGRFAKMNTGRIDLTFLSLSHNEAGTYNSIGGDWYAQNFMNLLTMTRVNAPYGGVVLVGQNPKTPYPGVRGSVNAWHADRIRALNDLAAAGNHGWIDAYEALAVDVATYVDPDAVHPTIAGYDLWAAVAWAYMEQA